MTEYLKHLTDFISNIFANDAAKVIGSVIFALFIAWANHKFGIWRDEQADKRKREGQLAYSTALLVSTLRQYMQACMVVMNDEGEEDRSENYGDWKPSVPAPKIVFPDKIDWTLFDSQLMYDILELPVMEDSQREAVSFAYDMATPPDRHGFIDERKLRYAELAYVTMSHLQKIHEKHPTSFTPVSVHTAREITLTLETLQKERERERKDLEEWSRHMNKEHQLPLPAAEGGSPPAAPS